MVASAGKLMLSKALKLLECTFLARVPAMTLPLKTMQTPCASGQAAKSSESGRFVLALVTYIQIGFCAPVMMIGLGEF